MATQGEASSGPAPLRMKCAPHLYTALIPHKPEVVFKLSANYRGRELQLDMTGPSLEVYTLVAIKSKVPAINLKA